MPHMYYVGHDGHKDNSVFWITTASGNFKDCLEVPATDEGMEILIEKMKGKKFMVLAEASTYTINLHDYLVSRGVESYLAHPTKLKLITESLKKTDRNDSATLAMYLRLWHKHSLDLSISFIVTGTDRELRELCRYREFIAQEKGQIMQRISAHMRINDQKCEFKDKTTKSARRWIRDRYSYDLCLVDLIDLYSHYETIGDKVDRELEAKCGDREDVKLLQSIPGIGFTTAVELVSMIVDVNRFPSADHMRSYFGLAPKVRDSGASVKHGHITKRGDPMMRSILGRSVGQFLKNAPNDSVSVYYRSHKGSMKGGTLMVACENKLLNIVYAILTRGTPYMSR